VLARLAQRKLARARLANEGTTDAARRERVLATTLPSRLQAFEKRNKIRDLVGFEAKLRHGRMSGHDPLGKALLKCFDPVALVQRPEWWRRPEGTLAGQSDGMTPRAMGLREGSAAVYVLPVGQSGIEKECQNSEVNNSSHGVLSAAFGEFDRIYRLPTPGTLI
jgi:hypothetical protein